MRAKGFSYETMAEANVWEMIRWRLGALVDRPFFAMQISRIERTMATPETFADFAEPGSAFGRMMAFSLDFSKTKDLMARYPDLEERAAEFASSKILRSLPSITFPARLRAALAATPNRKMKLSDGYDIEHLSRGLARCDVVTADSGMTQLCRSYKLVPSDCELLGYRELDRLPEAIAAAHQRLDA